MYGTQAVLLLLLPLVVGATRFLTATTFSQHIVDSGLETLLLVHGRSTNPGLLERARVVADEIDAALKFEEESGLAKSLQVASYHRSNAPTLLDSVKFKDDINKHSRLSFVWFGRNGAPAKVLGAVTNTGAVLRLLARHSPLLAGEKAKGKKKKKGKKKRKVKKSAAHKALLAAVQSGRNAATKFAQEELIRRRKQTHEDWLVLMEAGYDFKLEAPVDIKGDYGMMKHTHAGTRREEAKLPRRGDKVLVHYEAMSKGGITFDNSYQSKMKAPLEFPIGRGHVVECLDYAVASMRVGERAIILCAPEYAFKDEVEFSIKSSKARKIVDTTDTLRFDVELVGIAHRTGEL